MGTEKHNFIDAENYRDKLLKTVDETLYSEIDRNLKRRDALREALFVCCANLPRAVEFDLGSFNDSIQIVTQDDSIMRHLAECFDKPLRKIAGSESRKDQHFYSITIRDNPFVCIQSQYIPNEVQLELFQGSGVSPKGKLAS